VTERPTRSDDRDAGDLDDRYAVDVDEVDANESTDAASSVLRLILVSYDDRPDRATLCPAGLSGVDRMETWLTADASAFVDVVAYR